MIKDIRKKVDSIVRISNKIKSQFAKSNRKIRSKYKKELLKNFNDDPIYIKKEIGNMIERIDIEEEILRLHSHLQKLKKILQSKKPKGLDSLLSIAQMPKGIPVGTLAIGEDGAINAALFV